MIMKKEAIFLAVMLLIFVFGSGVLVYGQSGKDLKSGFDRSAVPPPPPDGRGRFPGRDPFDQLDLTESQRDLIDAVRISLRDASREQEIKVRNADEQLRAMIAADAYTAEKATPVLRAKAEALTEIELFRLAGEVEIRKVLTTEQKAKLAQLAERRPPPPDGRNAPWVN